MICSITCGFCKFCRTERQHLCQTKKTMGFLTKWGEGPAYLRRYKDGLWAEYCRRASRATWFVSLLDADINEMCEGLMQINVGYRALKRARLHSGEIVLVNGASGITGIGTVLSALAMGAPLVIAVARNPARLERVPRHRSQENCNCRAGARRDRSPTK